MRQLHPPERNRPAPARKSMTSLRPAPPENPSSPAPQVRSVNFATAFLPSPRSPPRCPTNPATGRENRSPVSRLTVIPGPGLRPIGVPRRDLRRDFHQRTARRVLHHLHRTLIVATLIVVQRMCPGSAKPSKTGNRPEDDAASSFTSLSTTALDWLKVRSFAAFCALHHVPTPRHNQQTSAQPALLWQTDLMATTPVGCG